MTSFTPGPIALLGSGESAPANGPVYEAIARRYATPLSIAVLETPAGFEPNSARVADKVADALRQRLQNYRPDVRVLPARARGTPLSPDAPEVTDDLRRSDLIFLGPGSPTYTVRQLRDSLAWHRICARHLHGAALVFVSAATLAVSSHTLPVYEIYKAGMDLHWQPGLDLLGAFGLDLVIVPHWNNSEGGAELDTSRCYMGGERFGRLLEQLPAGQRVVGIDEHSGLVIDIAATECRVFGKGGVSLLRDGVEQRFERGTAFPIALLGDLRQPQLNDSTDAVFADMARAADLPDAPPDAVAALLGRRQAARAAADWAAADSLRREIVALGWQVRDTPGGAVAEPLGH